MSLRIRERRRARFHAIQALYQKALAYHSTEELKQQFYDDNVNRHSVEWEFFFRLIEGVEQNKFIIDQKINHYAVNNLSSINPINLAILRLGSYELLDCFDVPYQVILNEYVNQAKDLGTEEGHSFINSLLDKIAKDFRKNHEICNK